MPQPRRREAGAADRPDKRQRSNHFLCAILYGVAKRENSNEQIEEETVEMGSDQLTDI